MPLVISDANIFIDIDVGGLTRAMFQLPEEFAVPNVLYEEELSMHHPELPAYGLRILEVREEFVREAIRLGRIYPKAGHYDLLALALAKQEKCPLLTGDSTLRLAAEAEEMIVKGTLWLMEQLVANRLLNHKEANIAYMKMKQQSRRLPWDEVEKQLARLNKAK